MSDRVALVLDGHGWAVRAVVKSLAEDGWRVLAPRGTKSARSRLCAGAVTIPDYRSDVSAFVEVVSEIIRSCGVELVAPAEDGSLELLYREVRRGDARVLGGDRASAMLALDKVDTLTRAQAAGFHTPRWFAPQTTQDAVSAAQEIGFPCVLKPRRSYARVGNVLHSARLAFADCPEQARRHAEGFVAAGFDVPLVQEWVQGRSIGVATVVHDGRVLAWGAREAFSQIPVRGGSAVWRATVSEREPGVDQALALLQSLGFEGMGDVQYHIARDGTPTLMEIGARTYGWLPLTIAAGADLPAIAARALDGREPVDTIVARPGMHMRWMAGEVGRLLEIAHPGAQLPPGATRADVLRQLSPMFGPSMHYDGWRTGDRPWPLANRVPGLRAAARRQRARTPRSRPANSPRPGCR